MSNVQGRPSKKDFADAINQITGKKIVTEKKLDQMLQGAKRSFQQRGMNGFFDYLRKTVRLPVSNEWMENTWKQMQTTTGTKQVFQQLDVPTHSLIPSMQQKKQNQKRKKK